MTPDEPLKIPQRDPILQEQSQLTAEYHSAQRKVEAFMRQYNVNLSTADGWKKSILKVQREITTSRKHQLEKIPDSIREQLKVIIEKRQRVAQLERKKPNPDRNSQKGHEFFIRILKSALKSWFPLETLKHTKRATETSERGLDDMTGRVEASNLQSLDSDSGSPHAFDFLPELSLETDEVVDEFDMESYQQREAIICILDAIISGWATISKQIRLLAAGIITVPAFFTGKFGSMVIVFQISANAK